MPPPNAFQPSSSPIDKISLDVAASILSQCDTVQEVYPVIQSHRVFQTAFELQTCLILKAVITAQIPEDLLPFSMTLLSSDDGGWIEFLTAMSRLPSLMADKALVDASLSGLPKWHYSGMSKTYAAAKFLAQLMAEEVKPLAAEKFRLGHPLEKASAVETFRLERAMLRFDLMCSMFCSWDCAWLDHNDPVRHRPIREFFGSFSPWVNEQMLCAYEFLKKKIRQGKFTRCCPFS